MNKCFILPHSRMRYKLMQGSEGRKLIKMHHIGANPVV